MSVSHSLEVRSKAQADGVLGNRGSVVMCATYKREIAGSIPGCAEYASMLCS